MTGPFDRFGNYYVIRYTHAAINNSQLEINPPTDYRVGQMAARTVTGSRIYSLRNGWCRLILRHEFGCILPAMNRNLDRREFVKLAGAAGVVAAASLESGFAAQQ